MKKFNLLLSCVLCLATLGLEAKASSTDQVSQTKKSQSYPYNPFVPLEVWRELEPYFLPVDHPIKRKLDAIFQKKRAIQNKDAFEKAGFGRQKEREPGKVYIGRHFNLEGYLIKVYLDSQPNSNEWMNWLERIKGAESIRKFIKKHHYSGDFKVPKKWLYPLPASPSPPEGSHYVRKNFILVVEDMRVLKKAANDQAYYIKMTPQLLKTFYTIITKEGLIDSIYTDNAPFTADGRIAFIDIEHHHTGPVQYEKLLRKLSPAMQTYWKKLIKGEGK